MTTALAGRTGPEQARVGGLVSLGSREREQQEGGIAEGAEDSSECLGTPPLQAWACSNQVLEQHSLWGSGGNDMPFSPSGPLVIREAAADSNLAACVFRKARQETLRSGPGDQGEFGCALHYAHSPFFPPPPSAALPSHPSSQTHSGPEAGAVHTGVRASGQAPSLLKNQPR